MSGHYGYQGGGYGGVGAVDRGRAGGSYAQGYDQSGGYQQYGAPAPAADMRGASAPKAQLVGYAAGYVGATPQAQQFQQQQVPPAQPAPSLGSRGEPAGALPPYLPAPSAQPAQVAPAGGPRGNQPAGYGARGGGGGNLAPAPLAASFPREYAPPLAHAVPAVHAPVPTSTYSREYGIAPAQQPVPAAVVPAPGGGSGGGGGGYGREYGGGASQAPAAPAGSNYSREYGGRAGGGGAAAGGYGGGAGAGGATAGGYGSGGAAGHRDSSYSAPATSSGYGSGAGSGYGQQPPSYGSNHPQQGGGGGWGGSDHQHYQGSGGGGGGYAAGHASHAGADGYDGAGYSGAVAASGHSGGQAGAYGATQNAPYSTTSIAAHGGHQAAAGSYNGHGGHDGYSYGGDGGGYATQQQGGRHTGFSGGWGTQATAAAATSPSGTRQTGFSGGSRWEERGAGRGGGGLGAVGGGAPYGLAAGGAAAARDGPAGRRPDTKGAAGASGSGGSAKAGGGTAAVAAGEPRARSLSPERPKAPEYLVRIPAFMMTQAERDHGEMCRRYPKLCIPLDFAAAVATWPFLLPAPGEAGGWSPDGLGISTLPTDLPARFEHELSPLQPDADPGKDSNCANAPAAKKQQGKANVPAAAVAVEPAAAVAVAAAEEEGVAAAPPASDAKPAPAASVAALAACKRKGPSSGGVGGLLDVRHSVRVLLLQGLTSGEREAVARGPHHDRGSHMVHAVKFVTARRITPAHKRGVLGALGGALDVALDAGGEEPVDAAALEAAYRAAATRHARRQAGVDLSRCRRWFRICEVHYLRQASERGGAAAPPRPAAAAAGPLHPPSFGAQYLERVVLYCVLAQELMPSAAEWPALYGEVVAWRALKQAAEDAEKGLTKGAGGSVVMAAREGSEGPVPSSSVSPVDGTSGDIPEPFIHMKGMHTKSLKLRTAPSTLHSLLDYDEEDDAEPTFELCVFAECFHEMLLRDYACTVLHELSGGRYPTGQLAGLPVVLPNRHEGSAGLLKQEASEPPTLPPAKKARLEGRRTNMPLLMAFRYVDRSGCGYLKLDDLRRLLHLAGADLPHRVVKQLVLANLPDRKADRVHYRELTDTKDKESAAVAPPPPPPGDPPAGKASVGGAKTGSPPPPFVPPPPPNPPPVQPVVAKQVLAANAPIKDEEMGDEPVGGAAAATAAETQEEPAAEQAPVGVPTSAEDAELLPGGGPDASATPPAAGSDTPGGNQPMDAEDDDAAMATAAGDSTVEQDGAEGTTPAVAGEDSTAEVAAGVDDAGLEPAA